jgi:hypothetical protein
MYENAGSLLDCPLCGHCSEILFGIVFTKFIVYFDKEISDFRLCCGRFSHKKI